MKFYFAGWTTDCYGLFEKHKVECGLISYWELKGQRKWRRPKDFFLDSGAFSAFTQGAKIDIDDYCDFIKQNNPDVYCVLDEIGNFEVTKQRQVHMEAKGLTPIPTVHFGASKREIKYWMDGYEYIAIGGLVPHAKFRKRLFNWCDFVFSQVKYHWPKKIHAFGMGAKAFLMRYPCYSSDSTSWQRLAKYGTSNFKTCDNVNTFLKSKTTPPSVRFELEIQHHLKLEKFVTAVWASRGITWND